MSKNNVADDRVAPVVKSNQDYLEVMMTSYRKRLLLMDRRVRKPGEPLQTIEYIQGVVSMASDDIPIPVPPQQDADLPAFCAFCSYFECATRASFRHMGLSFRVENQKFKEMVYFGKSQTKPVNESHKAMVNLYCVVCESILNYIDVIIKTRFNTFRDCIMFPYKDVSVFDYLRVQESQSGIAGISKQWKDECIAIHKFCIFISEYLDWTIFWFTGFQTVYANYVVSGRNKALLGCLASPSMFGPNTHLNLVGTSINEFTTHIKLYGNTGSQKVINKYSWIIKQLEKFLCLLLNDTTIEGNMLYYPVTQKGHEDLLNELGRYMEAIYLLSVMLTTDTMKPDDWKFPTFSLVAGGFFPEDTLKKITASVTITQIDDDDV